MPNTRDISFATFNLYNLNLPGEPIYNDRDGWSENEFKAKVAWTARLIKDINADVIGFQECWKREALERVFDHAGLTAAYDIVARTTDPPGIQVALAAKKGLLAGEPEWIDAFPPDCRFEGLREARDAQESITVTIQRFSRPLLRVRIQPQGANPKPPAITVYVAHLKSKGPTDLRRDNKPPVLAQHPKVATSVAAHVRRIVEAGALRVLLDGGMKGNADPFVVIGDLNDGTLSISTELISAEPGYRFFAKSRAGSRSDSGLYTVEKLQQLRSFRDVYYTHVHQQKMESLDHIMVSDAFYDHADVRSWTFHAMEIHNDHLVYDDKSSRTAAGANDHAVVKAMFDWNPMAKVLAQE
jgi:predicted extracellular nuclease